MKNATRKLLLILVAIIMVLSLALTACTEKHDFTVKVVGPDGKPYTAALVQPCLVDDSAPGGLGECYAGVATDENGVAYLDLGKEITDKTAKEIEVHLLNLPSNLTYETVRMKKGETKTITVTEVSGGPALKNPKRGTGMGSYMTGEHSNKIDLDSFDPYVVVEGSYKLVFTSVSQKIFYAFEPADTGIYKVYSSGIIDPSVIQLQGTLINGITCWRDDEQFSNDNVSSDDYNFCYEFEVEEGTIESDEYIYFEVSIKDEDDVDTEAVITFEYVSESQGGDDVTSVNARETLVDYADPTESYVAMPLNGTAVCVKGSDGLYHKDNANGPIVFADLGTDVTLNSRHLGQSTTPFGLDKGFTQIVAQGASLVMEVDGKMYDYLPLATAYTTHSNSNGRYPLTDELRDFLNNYLTIRYGIEWFEELNNVNLPDQNSWVVWCGYYDGVTALERYEGNGGSGEDNNELHTGNFPIEIPANESVTYTYFSYTTVKLRLTPLFDTTDTKVTVSVYTQSPDNATTLELTDDNGLAYYEVEIEGKIQYSFVFSVEGGAATSVEFKIAEEVVESKEGSSENPIVITSFGTFENETVEVTSQFGFTDIESIYYSYTVKEGDTKLYFSWGKNTIIEVHVGYSYLYSTDASDAEKLTNGVDVSNMVGETITIIVRSEEPCHVSFTISNQSIPAQPTSKD